MNKILFFPTMRCNLKCSYCHFKVDRNKEDYDWTGYGKTHHIERELPYQDFLTFFEKVQPYHLEFSGGEPTIYYDFKNLVNNIHQGSKWAITSNTLGDLSDIDFSKLQCWTASCHTENQRFFDNIMFLKSNGVSVSISMVVTKANIENIIYRTIKYAKYGVRINLLRELNPGVSWNNTEEWEVLKIMKALGVNVVEDDIPPEYEFTSGWYCEGGRLYFSVMPDGKVYRCYSEAMTGEPLGDVKTFSPGSNPTECYRKCFGCAMDYKAHVYKLENKDCK